MPDNPTQPDHPRSVAARFKQWFAANRAHPAMVLVYLVAFTQIVRECYPFSHFPMYSNPSDQPSDYIYVADATKSQPGPPFAPLSMEDLFGVRAAKAKKILNTRLTDYAKKIDLQRQDLSPEQTSEVATTLLAFLRERGEAIGNSELLPARLSLVRGKIRAELGVALHQDEQLIAVEP